MITVSPLPPMLSGMVAGSVIDHIPVNHRLIFTAKVSILPLYWQAWWQEVSWVTLLAITDFFIFTDNNLPPPLYTGRYGGRKYQRSHSCQTQTYLHRRQSLPSPCTGSMVAGSIQNENTNGKYCQTKQFLYLVATFR
jgi:hypothetical protein